VPLRARAAALFRSISVLRHSAAKLQPSRTFLKGAHPYSQSTTAHRIQTSQQLHTHCIHTNTPTVVKGGSALSSKAARQHKLGQSSSTPLTPSIAHPHPLCHCSAGLPPFVLHHTRPHGTPALLGYSGMHVVVYVALLCIDSVNADLIIGLRDMCRQF
jgi:hypothetical protein